MLENLEPKEVLYYFEQISKIPRGSGNEKNISDYLVEFAKQQNLEFIQDEALNVIIKKAGTVGYENSPSVIIQGHMDMVCEKNSDTEHDFENEPIKILVDGDSIKADGTTLGADDGIALAYGLAILDSKTIEHPPLEIVFTVDEEVGMNGVYALDTSVLKSKMLINIDSEEEGKLLVSCAGGLKATINLNADFEKPIAGGKSFWIKVRGLKGGHSGSDIDKDRANSNKLMGRILNRLFKDFNIQLASISGGAKDNAIPRESDSIIVIDSQKESSLKDILAQLEKIFQNEFKNTDSDIRIEIENNDIPQNVFTSDVTKKIIAVLELIPNGIQFMSTDMKGLVETSNNIGVVRTSDIGIRFTSAVRSSVGSRKDEIRNQLECIADLIGGNITIKGEYPAWEYNPKSKLKEIFLAVYNQMYGKNMLVESIHAGLECGLFAKKMTDVDMVSIGPDMENVHTPEERISISSIARTWDYLKEVLKQLK